MAANPATGVATDMVSRTGFRHLREWYLGDHTGERAQHWPEHFALDHR